MRRPIAICLTWSLASACGAAPSGATRAPETESHGTADSHSAAQSHSAAEAPALPLAAVPAQAITLDEPDVPDLVVEAERVRVLGPPTQTFALPERGRPSPLGAALAAHVQSPAGPVLAIAPRVPYSAVGNVVYALGMAGFDRIRFLVVAEGQRRVFELVLPSLTSDEAAAAPAGLRLSARLAPEGIYLQGSGGAIGPGCEPAPDDPTVTGRDWSALRACLQRLKGVFPDETTCTVIATPDTPWEDVASAMSVIRGDARGAYFPDLYMAMFAL